MLKKHHQENFSEPSPLNTFTTFVPRQVTLANKKNQQLNMKNKNDSSDKTLNLESKKNKCKDPSPLLLSIASYLEHKGFFKTLEVFRSEASISKLDGLKIRPLDLDMYYKYLETSKCDAKSNNNVLEELDLLDDGVAEKYKEEIKCAAPVEPTIKKKTSKSNGSDVALVDQQPGDGNEFTKCVDDSDDKSAKSQVKKKKSKDKTKGSKSLQEEYKTDSADLSLAEGSLNPKDAKKKKNKSVSNSVGNSAVEKSSVEIVLDEKSLKSKDKKKKNTSISESLCVKDTEEFDQLDVGKNDLKKKNIPTLEDNAVCIDKKGSKKRKRLASEGNESQPDGKLLSKTIEASEDKENAGKKRKTKNGQVYLKMSQDICLDKKLVGLAEEKTISKGGDGETKSDVHENGDLEKNGREGSASQKSMKKQQNGSAEPKTVNAFQRVKINEVEFADDRLQDNSYWAKHGADIGYGAKAQEVLGQVRGRDFRHEKTKKKRGSYRGGQIDLQTHSIKFNYSDEE